MWATDRRISSRPAFSLVELLVVLAIITILLGLALPAVMSARTRARELVCQNNLHQMNIAVANYRHIFKAIPPKGTPGRVGGWMVELLPFLERKNLYEQSRIGSPIASAPKVLLKNPRIMRCPFRQALASDDPDQIAAAHYVLVPLKERKNCIIYDAPVTLSQPWAEGPELSKQQILSSKGPHNGGFFNSSNSTGVRRQARLDNAAEFVPLELPVLALSDCSSQDRISQFNYRPGHSWRPANAFKPFNLNQISFKSMRSTSAVLLQ